MNLKLKNEKVEFPFFSHPPLCFFVGAREIFTGYFYKYNDLDITIFSQVPAMFKKKNVTIQLKLKQFNKEYPVPYSTNPHGSC